MIRVLFIPLNYGPILQDWCIEAFRKADCSLEIFDYFTEMERYNQDTNTVRHKLIKNALQFQPDVILAQIQHTTIIDKNTLLEIKRNVPKTILVNYTHDIRSRVEPTYKEIASIADYNFICSTGQLDLYKREIPNKNIQFWPTGYNNLLYYSESTTRESFHFDLSFIANDNSSENYPGRNERLQAVRILNETFGNRFAVFGDGWPPSSSYHGPVNQRRVCQDVYWKSLACLSISHFNNIDHYFSDRLLMALSSGRPVICYKYPKWESYFTHNCDILIAESINEIINHVNTLKQNYQLSHFIGQNGANKAVAEHTYYNRILQLLSMIGLRK